MLWVFGSQNEAIDMYSETFTFLSLPLQTFGLSILIGVNICTFPLMSRFDRLEHENQKSLSITCSIETICIKLQLDDVPNEKSPTVTRNSSLLLLFGLKIEVIINRVGK
jgi:hypothetical protein